MKTLFKLLTVLSLGLALSACGGSNAPAGATDTSGSSAVTALKTTDPVVGTGATATAGATINVKYTGYLYDGKIAGFKGKQFDAGTISFRLGAGQVITGWDQGLLGMKVGGKRTIVIPASLGYGASGAGGGAIPANAALVFDVELLGVI